MYCPRCKTAADEGDERCTYCSAPLVASLPAAPARGLVAVFNTTDPALLPIVRSVLDAAEIPYVVQGEAGVSVFPLGPVAARVTNRLTGVTILVERDRAEEVAALLDVEPPPPR